MSNNNSNDQEKVTKENIFQKGWKDFTSGLQEGFKKFQTNMEQQAHKNKEQWDQNKDKASKFFADAKKKWDERLEKTIKDIKDYGDVSIEQLEAQKIKIKQDFEQWQDKTREDFSKGMKTLERGFLKYYIIGLLLVLPVVIIVVVVLAVVNKLF
ncbi:MAG: hypothetical protein JW891_10580 [Candidatus Lokiarchaeota archaeon]|nr:hypothetical protein [Candidatus Lokiarchaeota archaeon]